MKRDLEWVHAMGTLWVHARSDRLFGIKHFLPGLLFSACLAIACPSHAAFECNVNGVYVPAPPLSAGSFVATNPASPGANQFFTLYVGVSGWAPDGLSVQTAGNVINATLTGGAITFLPPSIICGTGDLVLAAGQYTVNVYTKFQTFAPVYQGTTTLAVGQGPANVPATTPLVVGLLALMVALAGGFGLLHRSL
jgi:hypothetical protein